MNRGETWKTWVGLAALIIFAGIASGAWLWLSNREEADEVATIPEAEKEAEPIVIRIEDYVLGEELNQIPLVSENINGRALAPWQAIALVSALIVVGIGGMGAVISGAIFLISRSVTTVSSDENYVAAQAALEKHEKERLQQLRESRREAAEPSPEKKSYRGFIATSLVILFLVWVAIVTFSRAFLEDASWSIGSFSIGASSTLTVIVLLVTIGVLTLLSRRSSPALFESGRTDSQPINWGIIWVILSGLLIVGLGTGLAIAMRLI